jgi:hypothetical protein
VEKLTSGCSGTLSGGQVRRSLIKILDRPLGSVVLSSID